MPGTKSSLGDNGKILSGDYLMKVGIDAFSGGRLTSRVIELVAQLNNHSEATTFIVMPLSNCLGVY